MCVAGECIEGNCDAQCPDDAPVCCFDDNEARCRNIRVDRFHCGGCGIVCPDGTKCDGGLCANGPN
jgi:hypothetical protein